MDIVIKCLTECITCLAKQLLWIILLAVLFALLVLFLMMGGFDQAWFIDILTVAVAGAAIISLICCLCKCCQRLEG